MQPDQDERPTEEQRGDRQAALYRLQRAQISKAVRIRRAVAAGYGASVAQLCQPGRRREVAEARQVAMFLMRADLCWPLETRNAAFPCARIGAILGERDHSTVLHGVAVIAARLDTDKALRFMVGGLRAELDAAEDTGRAGIAA